MKANILNELERELKTRKERDKKNDVLGQVTGLLEYEGEKDIRMLRDIAPNSTLCQSESERAAIMELERKEEYLNGRVFTYDQIITLGAKYRLKFLPTERYKSYIDPGVIPEIRDLQRAKDVQRKKDQAVKRNMTLDEYEASGQHTEFQFDAHELKNNFFILAPGSMFKTEKTKAFSIKPKDPIMFYREDGTHYRLIKKWGNDFSVFRRLLGFVTKSWATYVFYLYTLPYITITLALSISFSANYLWMLMVLVVVGIWRLATGDDLYLDKDFAGDRHVTSTKSFHI